MLNAKRDLPLPNSRNAPHLLSLEVGTEFERLKKRPVHKNGSTLSRKADCYNSFNGLLKPFRNFAGGDRAVSAGPSASSH